MPQISWHHKAPGGETVEELKFFDVDDIPEDISEPIRPVFREYIKMRKRE